MKLFFVEKFIIFSVIDYNFYCCLFEAVSQLWYVLCQIHYILLPPHPSDQMDFSRNAIKVVTPKSLTEIDKIIIKIAFNEVDSDMAEGLVFILTNGI